MRAPLLIRSRVFDVDVVLRAIGDALMRHQRTIRALQWLVVVVYFALLTVPALLDLPPRTAHVWTNLTLFSQFVFWGLWWPFVLISMMLVGRLWCGLLCPEGALSEWVSARSRGHAIPAWLKWPGWPFVAFAGTTIYGQMISVYQYPKPALAILGFSTVGAVGIAFFYGRNKRVWCRYLCPVTGVFALLAKLAPVHFRVDPQAWDAWRKVLGARSPKLNCAPLVPIRTMRGAAACHMCGRCSGFRGAVTLARRSPNHEIVHVAGAEPRPVETLLIVFGLMGLAAGAFHWTNSDLYIAVKQTIAEWLVAHDIIWPLEGLAPWWILTNYPARNDVMSLLDGTVLIGYMLGVMVAVGSLITVLLLAAMRLLGRWSLPRFHHLAQALIPLAGCGVFLGLSSLTVTLLRNDGFALDFVAPLRAGLLLGAVTWSLWLGWQIAALYAGSLARRVLAMMPFALALGVSAGTWASLFWSF